MKRLNLLAVQLRNAILSEVLYYEIFYDRPLYFLLINESDHSFLLLIESVTDMSRGSLKLTLIGKVSRTRSFRLRNVHRFGRLYRLSGRLNDVPFLIHFSTHLFGRIGNSHHRLGTNFPKTSRHAARKKHCRWIHLPGTLVKKSRLSGIIH